jgi:hypothetical protein
MATPLPSQAGLAASAGNDYSPTLMLLYTLLSYSVFRGRWENSGTLLIVGSIQGATNADRAFHPLLH